MNGLLLGYTGNHLTYLVGGLEHEFYMTFHSVGNVNIPTDELILFRGVGSTTSQLPCPPLVCLTMFFITRTISHKKMCTKRVLSSQLVSGWTLKIQRQGFPSKLFGMLDSVPYFKTCKLGVAYASAMEFSQQISVFLGSFEKGAAQSFPLALQ